MLREAPAASQPMRHFSAASRRRPVKSDLSRSSITLVIGFAPRKVVLAEHFFRMRRINGNSDGLTPAFACSARLGATCRCLALAVHSLSLARHWLAYTRRQLAHARHFLSLLVLLARKCRGSDRKRQVVPHRGQPASVGDSLPEGKVEFCLPTKLQPRARTSLAFALGA